jgi:hypothetical protein
VESASPDKLASTFAIFTASDNIGVDDIDAVLRMKSSAELHMSLALALENELFCSAVPDLKQCADFKHCAPPQLFAPPAGAEKSQRLVSLLPTWRRDQDRLHI